jgi:ankyrin repeat protein
MYALFDEIRNGNLAKVREIIETNPTLINKYLYGATPFLYSLECSNQDIAFELALNPNLDFELKDNLDICCLEKAIESKMYKIVEIISRVSKKHDMNNIILSNNETFLTNSLKMNDTQVSIALIKGGFDLNTPNKLNEYPLQLAIKFNQIDVVRTMLETKRLQIRTLDQTINYNPLIDCCEKDLTELSLLLIDYGMDLDGLDNKDQLWTPLCYAITNNNEIIVDKLTSHKCNVNTIDIEGKLYKFY